MLKEQARSGYMKYFFPDTADGPGIGIKSLLAFTLKA
jgi:hypothetical protein